eukprot:3941243-Rhodomonas_salina.3
MSSPPPCSAVLLTMSEPEIRRSLPSLDNTPDSRLSLIVLPAITNRPACCTMIPFPRFALTTESVSITSVPETAMPFAVLPETMQLINVAGLSATSPNWLACRRESDMVK